MLRQTIGAPLDPSSSQQEIRELREKLRESEKLLTESTRYSFSHTSLKVEMLNLVIQNCNTCSVN